MTGTVLILGANGKIGRHSERAFAAAGWTVRRYRRGTDMNAAALGADVIVNGLNPPNYHNWGQLIPRITAQAIAAAKASGATIIIPGNVYNFGETPGTWSEATPQCPTTRKGRIRVEMEQAYRRSGVRTIVLRAGNFIDPEGADTVLNLVMLKDIRRGRITTLGPDDVVQTYAYLPDWARAARMLAERRDGLRPFEDVPLPGLAFSTANLRDHLQRLTGRTLTIARFPWWLMTLASPVWELAREMREMRGLFATAHRLDGTRLAHLVPDFEATPLDQVLRSAIQRDVDPDKAVPGRGLGLPA